MVYFELLDLSKLDGLNLDVEGVRALQRSFDKRQRMAPCEVK